jgi:hypothetical protein
MRAMAPTSADVRRLRPESFGLDFADRPEMRAILACFSFFAGLGRTLSMLRLTRILRVPFSYKCLKNWYRLTKKPFGIARFNLWICSSVCVLNRRTHGYLRNSV